MEYKPAPPLEGLAYLNPKHEIRNSKQFQMTKIQNERKKMFGTFDHLDFEFVLDFDIRISDLSAPC